MDRFEHEFEFARLRLGPGWVVAGTAHFEIASRDGVVRDTKLVAFEVVGGEILMVTDAAAYEVYQDVSFEITPQMPTRGQFLLMERCFNEQYGEALRVSAATDAWQRHDDDTTPGVLLRALPASYRRHR